MKKAKFLLISTVILILCSISTIFVVNYRSKGNQEETHDSVNRNADVVIKNIHYTNTHLGITEWELDASSGEYFGDDKQAILNDVTVTLFLEDGGTLLLVGEKGKIATDTKNIEIWGNVTATSDKGYKFRTASLRYDSKKKKVFTSDSIVFTGYGMKLTGTGITVDIDRERFFVLNNVSTIFKEVKED